MLRFFERGGQRLRSDAYLSPDAEGCELTITWPDGRETREFFSDVAELTRREQQLVTQWRADGWQEIRERRSVSANPTPASSRILLVEDNQRQRIALAELLAGEGYTVIEANDFTQAKALLNTQTFDLLITDLRLGQFNGLQLVLQIRSDNPDAGAIVITGFDDKVLENDARRYGAAYLVKPIRGAVLVDTVVAELTKHRPRRRWPRCRVPDNYVAKIAETVAQVIDVSYGGFSFALERQSAFELPPRFSVTFPAGPSVSAEAVWRDDRNPRGTIRYGAAVVDAEVGESERWRAFVDLMATPPAAC